MGLAGVVVLHYASIVECGMRTALATRDPFGKLLDGGPSPAFALQVFVVAGGVMGLIPLTSTTVPSSCTGAPP